MTSENDKGVSGLSRIARRLADLIDALGEIEQSGKLPRRGRQEKNGVVVEYSLGRRSLRPDADEEPVADTSARAPRHAETARPRQPDLVEPATDIFDEDDEIIVLFDLPGVHGDYSCILDGDILALDAKSGSRHFRKEILVQGELADETPRLSFRNGILEARLRKRPQAQPS